MQFHLNKIEVIGIIAIILAIFSSLAQFLYINKTHNVESFAFEYIFLMIIIEFLWCIQGIFKKSITITIAKGIGCAYFSWLLYLSLKNNSHKGKTIKDKFFSEGVKIKDSILYIIHKLKQIILNKN
jgi:uncharacterized protein with PQ loop repeat